MKTASELIDWYNNEIEQILGLKEQLHGTPLGGFVSYFWEEGQRAPNFCQCNTEALFELTKNPLQLRAYMMVSALIDQMMWTHFQNIYDSFRSVFQYPKVHAHASGGCASPSWFLQEKREVDWPLIEKTTKILLNELYEWIQLGAIKKVHGKETPSQPKIMVPTPDRYGRLKPSISWLGRTELKLKETPSQPKAMVPAPDRYGWLKPFVSWLGRTEPKLKETPSQPKAMVPAPERYRRSKPSISWLSRTEPKLTDSKRSILSKERATGIILRFQKLLKEEIDIEFREQEANKLTQIVEKYEVERPLLVSPRFHNQSSVGKPTNINKIV